MNWLFTGEVILFILIILGFCYLIRDYFNLRAVDRGGRKIVLLGILICIILLHTAAFNPALDTNGDNASYIINAKSLIERGNFYRLSSPDAPLDYKASVGLPLILVPVYLIFGVNFTFMKILILLMAIASVILIYLIFKETVYPALAAIIALLFALNPYTLLFSSMIMTEIPFIFWSLVSFFFLNLMLRQKKIKPLLIIITAVAIFLSYLTRAVGIGFPVAVLLYMLIRLKVWQILKAGGISRLEAVGLKKFLFLAILLLILFTGWQLRYHLSAGSSQVSEFTSGLSEEKISGSFKTFWEVLAPNIFASDTVRRKHIPMDFKLIFIILLVIAGILKSILRQEPFGYYFIIISAVLILGNPAHSSLVFSRYLYVLTPFLLYFLYLGTDWIVGVFRSQNLRNFCSSLLLFLVLTSSFSGVALAIQKAHKGELYPPAFRNFLNAAVWAHDNLPAGSIVASRKERIFYLYSGLPGFKHTTYHDGNTPEHQRKRLQKIESYDADYLVIDIFNSSTYNNVYPMVKDNPDKFKLIHRIGDKRTNRCLIYEVIKWWDTEQDG